MGEREQSEGDYDDLLALSALSFKSPLVQTHLHVPKMSTRSPERTAREIEDKMVQLRIDQKDGPVGDEELEQFRMEWRQEVKARSHAPGLGGVNHAHPIDVDSSTNIAKSSGKGKEKHHEAGGWKTVDTSPERRRVPNGDIAANTTTSPRQSLKSLSPVTSPLTIKRPLVEDALVEQGTSRSPERPRVARAFGRKAIAQGDAVSIYARAVEAEQGGQLNDALNLYRQAFKLDGESKTASFGVVVPLVAVQLPR